MSDVDALLSGLDLLIAKKRDLKDASGSSPAKYACLALPVSGIVGASTRWATSLLAKH